VYQGPTNPKIRYSALTITARIDESMNI
jgi:hypothetical protein